MGAARTSSGEGRESTYPCLIPSRVFGGAFLLDKWLTLSSPDRSGSSGICPYGVFTSADAKRFVLSVQNEAEWRRLCTLGLNRPDMLDDSLFGQ